MSETTLQGTMVFQDDEGGSHGPRLPVRIRPSADGIWEIIEAPEALWPPGLWPVVVVGRR